MHSSQSPAFHQEILSPVLKFTPIEITGPLHICSLTGDVTWARPGKEVQFEKPQMGLILMEGDQLVLQEGGTIKLSYDPNCDPKKSINIDVADWYLLY